MALTHLVDTSVLTRLANEAVRSVAAPLIAAAAETEGLTLLHYDADFDLIASVTGQRCDWIVPRGSIS